MLTLSVVIVPNQNWSPDHTIQSKLLGFLTPVFLTILTQHLNGTEQINPNLVLLLCPDHPIRPGGFFVKLRVLSHVLVNSWTSLRKVKRGP